jgi:hypothetical protein
LSFVYCSSYSICPRYMGSICPRRMGTSQHIAFTVLDGYDVLNIGEKPTPASVQVSALIFRLLWISLLHDVVKRVRNRTERFRCVFGIADGFRI